MGERNPPARDDEGLSERDRVDASVLVRANDECL
jgi:hypothetical protein